MSPIRELDAAPPRLAVIVKIRGGFYDPQKRRPEQSDGFTFTSPSEATIRELEADYGGEVDQYVPQGQRSGTQWRLISGAERIIGMFPAADADAVFDQHFELWTALGCSRRCDGVELVSGVDGTTGEVLAGHPCVCDPANRECQPRTRLRLWLPQLVGLGVAEVVTTSWWAMRDLHDQIRMMQAVLGGDLRSAPVELTYLPKRITYDKGKRSTVKRIYGLDLAMRPAELVGMNRDPLAIAARVLEQTGRELPSWARPANPLAEQPSLPPAQDSAGDSGSSAQPAPVGPLSEAAAASDPAGRPTRDAAQPSPSSVQPPGAPAAASGTLTPHPFGGGPNDLVCPSCDAGPKHPIHRESA